MEVGRVSCPANRRQLLYSLPRRMQDQASRQGVGGTTESDSFRVAFVHCSEPEMGRRTCWRPAIEQLGLPFSSSAQGVLPRTKSEL